MHSPQRARVRAGGLVELDEGTVFARYFPRSENGVVSFYETASSPQENSFVHTHSWWNRGCPQCGVWSCVGIRGRASIMGEGGVVRIAEVRTSPVIGGRPPITGLGSGCPQCGVRKVSPAGLVSQKLTTGRLSVAVSPGRKTVLSAFTRPPAADLHQGDVLWVRTNNGCGWCCPQCVSRYA